MRHVDRYVIARDRNVVRVDFPRTEPPAPKFPGAGALRMPPSPGSEWLECPPFYWLAVLTARPGST